MFRCVEIKPTNLTHRYFKSPVHTLTRHATPVSAASGKCSSTWWWHVLLDGDSASKHQLKHNETSDSKVHRALTTAMLCLITDTYKARMLTCLVSGVNRIGDKSRLFSVVLNILETVQFCPVLSAVWMRFQRSPSFKLKTGSKQDELGSHHVSRPDKTVFEIFCCRQSWQVAVHLSVSTVWTSQLTPSTDMI